MANSWFRRWPGHRGRSPYKGFKWFADAPALVCRVQALHQFNRLADGVEQSFICRKYPRRFPSYCHDDNIVTVCETEISRWNTQKRRPIIRAWRGYQLQGILSRFPAIRLKYGLLSSSDDKGASFVSLAIDATKFTQASYAASMMNQNDRISLEAAAALAELLSARMMDFETAARIVVAEIDPKVDQYEWLTISSAGKALPLDRFGFRALASVFRATLRCSSVCVQEQDGVFVFLPKEKRLTTTSASLSVLRRVSFWSNVEITPLADDAISVATRELGEEG